MRLRMAALVSLVSILGPLGCMVGTEDESLGVEREAASSGGWCATSGDCNARSYCSTEAGDCLTLPSCRNRICAGVCWGRCEPVEACGDATCEPGLVCCNESCGICTEPGGYCTQQVCEPTPEQ